MSPLGETAKQVVVESDRSRRKKKNNNHGRHSSSPDCRSRRVKFGQLLRQEAASELELEEDEDQISCHSYTSSRGSNASTSSCTTITTSSSSPRLSSFHTTTDDNNNYYYSSSPAANHLISSSSPYTSQSSSPFLKSPWIKLSPLPHPTPSSSATSLYFSRGRKCLIGSLLREEGHVYSLAANDGMLYTGSESNNIRVWRNFQDAGGFKSGSGLVKAIVTSNDDEHEHVFTGHQDGKIRIWTPKGKRVGTLPKFGDYIKSSMNPNNYVEVRRHHKVPKIKHFDAVSCMSLNQQLGLLYSGSWDKTIKVWRISDGKCLESFEAHDDAINSIAVGSSDDGLVFSGSADGTVKVWRRELDGRSVKHFHVKTLLTQEYAVTALAVADDDQGWVLYAGSSDGLVNFWERDNEQGLVYGGVLRGHKLAVLCLATAGSLVFTGSTDKTICVWNREAHGDHSCLAVLSAHTGPVKCLAVELDHDDPHDDLQLRDWILYSGSLDKSVKIWRLSPHALLHQPFTY